MELTLPRSVKEASKQEKRQLVPGSSGKPTTLLIRGASNPITQTSPINLPSLPSSVVEQGCIHSAKASNCTSDGARASSPRKESSRIRRRNVPSALQQVNPEQVTLPTLSPPSHLPPIPMPSSRNQPLSPRAYPLRPPFPVTPQPEILSAKRTPVPKFSNKKASTMPQESSQCLHCKVYMKKIKVLTFAVEGFIKECPTHSCSKKSETPYRKRFMSV